MKQTVVMYAVVPPEAIDLVSNPMYESLAMSEDLAWRMFPCQALSCDGYEAYGFAAKRVKVTIEVLEGIICK